MCKYFETHFDSTLLDAPKVSELLKRNENIDFNDYKALCCHVTYPAVIKIFYRLGINVRVE